MPVSFKVADTTPSTLKQKAEPFNIILSNDKVVRTSYNKILDGSNNQVIKSHYYNGFVGLFIEAYNRHLNVSIRPDDVWISILIQFSKYVNRHAENLRNKFVDFKDKKTLEVVFNTNMENVPYDIFIKNINTMIHNNLNNDIEDWIMPNFSTTDNNDEIVCGALLMTICKNYFNYVCVCMCGIPQITLLGNIEDWQNLQNKIKKLIDFDIDGSMKSWSKNLSVIIDKFIQSFTNPDIEWWNSVRMEMGGSGSPRINGWIIEFMRFDNDGKYHYNDVMDTADIPVALANTPFKIIDVDCKEYDSTLIVGSIGYKKVKLDYMPCNDWIVMIK
jgi:hypothetical protein